MPLRVGDLEIDLRFLAGQPCRFLSKGEDQTPDAEWLLNFAVADSDVPTDAPGDKGEDAIEFFDKMKLVETKWTTPEEGIEGRPQKKYRSYYSAFNINISCPVNEISEIFTVASLNAKEFQKLEDDIFDYIGQDGKFGNMVAENQPGPLREGFFEGFQHKCSSNHHALSLSPR